MSKRIPQLPLAGPLQPTDLLILEQSDGTKKMAASVIDSSATAQQALADAAQAQADATQAIGDAAQAQADATQAIGDALLAQTTASGAAVSANTAGGLASSALSQVANKLDKTIAGVGNVTLDVPKQYGTHTNPLTGNITVSLTGADLSVVQFIYHTGSSAPTITVTGGTTVRWGGLEYTNNQTNIIGIFWMGGTEVGFSFIRKF